MAIVILCAASALLGFSIGVSMADRIADNKIKITRMEMGLDIETGQPIETKEDELYK